MPKILDSKINEDYQYLVDCLAETKEYDEFKDRITEQLLKSVDIKGFRKGHAPRDIAMSRLDPIKLQTTLVQETVQKFYTDLLPEIQKDIESKDLVAILGTASLAEDPDFNKETDQGFQFRVGIGILAEVNLDSLEKLEISLPKATEIEDRPSLKDFLAKEEKAVIKSYNQYKAVKGKIKANSRVKADVTEHQLDDQKAEIKESKDALITLGQNQLPPEFEEKLIGHEAGKKLEFKLDLPIHVGHTHLFEFKVNIIEVQEPVYTTLEEIFENSQEAKNEFKSPESFRELVEKVYNRETENLLNTIKKRRVIEVLVDKIPDFKLPKTNYEGEIRRILDVLSSRAVEQKISVREAFATSGLPGSKDKLKKDEEVKQKVEDYVKKEFKLIEVLRYIYYAKVENKVQEAELEDFKREIQKNPTGFGLESSDLSESKILDVAFDRLLREKALQFVLTKIKFKK